MEGVTVPRAVAGRWGWEGSRVGLVEADEWFAVDGERRRCVVRGVTRIYAGRVNGKENVMPLAGDIAIAVVVVVALGLGKQKTKVQLAGDVSNTEEVVALIDAGNGPDTYDKVNVPRALALASRDACH